MIKNRAHHILLISGLFSFCGTALTTMVTLSAFSKLVTGSEWFSIFFLSLTLPPLLLRRQLLRLLTHVSLNRVLIGAELGRATCVLILSVAIQTGTASVPLLIGFLIIQTSLTTIYVSAFFSNLPNLISRGAIEKYNSLNSSATQVGYLTGTALYGLSAGFVPDAGFLLIDAISFLISAAVLLFLTAYPQRENNPVPAAGSGKAPALAETIPVLGHLPLVSLAIIAALPVGALKLFNILASTVALKLSPFGAQGFSWIDSSAAGGVILGGLALSFLSGRVRVGNRNFALMIAAIFVCLIITAANRADLMLACATAFLFGLLYSVLITVARSSLYLFEKHANSLKEGVTLIGAIESGGNVVFALVVPAIVPQVSWTIAFLLLPSIFYGVLLYRSRLRQAGFWKKTILEEIPR